MPTVATTKRIIIVPRPEPKSNYLVILRKPQSTSDITLQAECSSLDKQSATESKTTRKVGRKLISSPYFLRSREGKVK